MGNVLRNLPDKRPQGIVVPQDQRQLDGGRVLLQTVASGPVFGEGVDIGIIPEPRDLDPVGTEYFNWLICAGRTADVKQSFHRSLPKQFGPIIPQS